MVDKMGQNCVLLDLNTGTPSKLKLSVITIELSMSEKIEFKLFLRPLYHIFPLLNGLITILVGVCINVLLSLGKHVKPANIRIVRRSFRALCAILCSAAQKLVCL